MLRAVKRTELPVDNRESSYITSTMMAIDIELNITAYTINITKQRKIISRRRIQHDYVK